jgi:glycosyltransferase involved in cell wall biosynthesis
MSIKVSIIIPVYNAEKYLVECIESLLVQTLKECEFIFINDGSKDSSLEILERYKKMDSRIILINQENQGVSIARNQGLSVATGEFVGFVDADDYIEKDMYEVLYNTAKQSDCDVVISKYESVIDGRKVISSLPFPLETCINKDYIQKEILPYFIKSDSLNAIWNKIYRNKILKEREMRFPEKITLGEDGLFNICIFSNIDKVFFTSYCGYHYRDVAGSATRKISEKDYFQNAINIYHMKIPEINTSFFNQIDIRKLKSFKLISSVTSFVHFYFTPTKELNLSNRYKYVKKMIKNKDVQNALIEYSEEYEIGLGRYELLIIKMIKRKLIIALYCLTAYSRFRNK